MKEISKKQLMNQILESQKEVTEMADYNPGREDKNPWDETPEERAARGLDPNYFQRKSKVTSLHFNRPPADQPEKEKTAPDMFIYDDPRPGNEGKKVTVVQRPSIRMVNEEQIEQINEKFVEWGNKMGSIMFLEVTNKIKHDPLEITKASPSKAAMRYRSQLGLEFPEKDPSRVETPKTKILKNLLNPTLRSLAESINSRLVAAGIPPIEIPERMFKSQKENIDRFSIIENDNITWETQNTYFYETVEDYTQNAKEKYRDRPESKPPRLTHLVRQYNPGRNWSPTRKTEKKGADYKADPLTPVLKLDKGGYSAHDYDVEMTSTLSIKGTPTQVGDENRTAFRWTIQFKTQYGKKLREESRVSGGLVDDKFFEATAVTEPLNRLVGSDGSIAGNLQIASAFREAINDIAAQIDEINAKEELRSRFAAAGRTDAYREVNESIDGIVNKIINELKQ